MSNKVLIVDDDQAMRALLSKLLGEAYRIETASTGEEALKIAPHFLPGVVLLDLMMPGIDGYETCRRLKALADGDNMQIIIVSGRSSRWEQRKAFEAGAHDYVVKPFAPQDVQSRVVLHFRLLDAKKTVASVKSEIISRDIEIQERDIEIQELEAARQRDLMAAQDIAVFTLAKVAESRDRETGEHLARMRSYTQILAEQLRSDSPYRDRIDDHFLEDLFRSSPLHDIGKVGICDAILLKPGKYLPHEFEMMKQHTVIGANILDDAVWHSKSGGFLAMAAVIARFHHERFDGTGYMAGLAGEEIPLPARIVALADVYDALTSSRPYKDASPSDEAKTMIEEEAGKHFDPVIVEAFQARFDDFVSVQQRFRNRDDVVFGAVSLHDEVRASTSMGNV